MKTILSLLIYLNIQSATAAETTIKWVGQFPSEQAGPLVELFNSKYSDKNGFKVEYKYDEKVVVGLLGGTKDQNYDLVHMKDADMLNTIGNQNLTQKLNIEETRSWPIQMKDASDRWVALVKRARIIYYNSELVSADEVKNYENLGDVKFKDKLCLRQKKAQYTNGLHSFFLGVWGEAKTTEVLRSWAVNTENIPLIEKDLDGVIVGIENGQCLVGVANTYYYVRHLADNPQTKVKPMLPNAGDIGVHINVDGIAVLNYSQNQVQAKKFVEWLLSEEAQLLLSDITGKFPANPAVKSAKLDAIFGDVIENRSFDLNEITNLKTRALQIATEQGLK